MPARVRSFLGCQHGADAADPGRKPREPPQMTTTKTILITGNTYPVKDQIKALGGRWNAASKGWMVPEEKASQARALVSGAPSSAPRRGSYGGESRELAACRRRGWDGRIGSSSYYSSGAFDEIDA